MGDRPEEAVAAPYAAQHFVHWPRSQGSAMLETPETTARFSEGNSVPSANLDKLSRELDRIDRPGTFSLAESVPAVLPGLEVEGLGPVGLPLNPRTAKELIRIRHSGPHGQGEEHLVHQGPPRLADGAGPLQPQEPRLGPGRQGDRRQGPGRARAGEPRSLRVTCTTCCLYEKGSFFLLLSRRREAQPDGRDARRGVALDVRGGRTGRPPRGAGADDRLRRASRRPVPHPLRRLLRRLRARGPAAREGVSPLPGLQPHAGEVEEVPDFSGFSATTVDFSGIWASTSKR